MIKNDQDRIQNLNGKTFFVSIDCLDPRVPRLREDEEDNCGYVKYLFYARLIFAYFLAIFTITNSFALPETQKYEAYLNSLKTLAGDFTQTNSRGQVVTGTIQISRPGKMRLTYNPPSSLLIVANGKWLITKDREADQVDYVSLENTPAAFILRPHVRFSGDVAVTNIIPKDDTTEISLIRTEEPDAGYITLVFQDNPVALKEWSIIDGQGIETRVTLSNIRTNLPLPPQLFAIESPSLIQQIF